MSVFSGFVARTARKAMKLSQEELAYRAGLTVSAYSRIETCKVVPMWHTGCNIAKALKIPVGKLHREVSKTMIGDNGLPLNVV